MRVVSLGKPQPDQTKDNPMFKGEVYMGSLVSPPEADVFRAIEVSFRPGARTVWHRHSADQLLFVTDGHGLIGDDEKEIEIRTGDLVFIPANERHWHGASPTTAMTHLAIMTPCENQLEED
jgi:quercetin dioxygenase-like cupin family protein